VEISVHDAGTLDTHVEVAKPYKHFIVGSGLERRSTQGGLAFACR
jgi:hypothetical protein